MNRVLVAAIVLMVCGTPASAQERTAFGVKVGINSANLQFDTEQADVNFERRVGFVGGLFVVWPADSRLALQTEVLYSQKGAKTGDIENMGSGRIELDFVDVPILLRVSSARGARGSSFHVFGGPSLEFRTRARAESTFEGRTEGEDVSDDVEKFAVGLVAGAGLEVGRFVVDGRYTWGLTNLNKDEQDDVKITNRVFSIMAGFRF